MFGEGIEIPMMKNKVEENLSADAKKGQEKEGETGGILEAAKAQIERMKSFWGKNKKEKEGRPDKYEKRGKLFKTCTTFVTGLAAYGAFSVGPMANKAEAGDFFGDVFKHSTEDVVRGIGKGAEDVVRGAGRGVGRGVERGLEGEVERAIGGGVTQKEKREINRDIRRDQKEQAKMRNRELQQIHKEYRRAIMDAKGNPEKIRQANVNRNLAEADLNRKFPGY